MLFPILEPSSLPVVVAQPDERRANRTASVLKWYDRYRTYSIWFKSFTIARKKYSLLKHYSIRDTMFLHYSFFCAGSSIHNDCRHFGRTGSVQ